jgi:hypothetical protein
VVMVGAGVWITYSAYKGHDPLTVALSILRGTTPSVAASLAQANPSTAANGQVTQQAGGGVTANGYSY